MHPVINQQFHYVSTVYFNQNLCKEHGFLLVYIYLVLTFETQTTAFCSNGSTLDL
jgi:hypothetical protein